GSRVVGVARDHVRVQVRDRVAEELVVQLHRLEDLFQQPAHRQQLVPEAERLLRGQLRRLDHVAGSEVDLREPALDARPVEERVGQLAGEEPDAVRVLVRPALVADRAADAALALVEPGRPLLPASIAAMTEAPEAFWERARTGSRVPPVEEWDSWPFAGELQVRELDPPSQDRPRHGAGGGDCSACQGGDKGAVWSDEHWTLRPLDA